MSLTIDNQSTLDLAVMSVTFSVGIGQNTYNYSINQEAMIGPQNIYFGIRHGGNSLSTIVVNLVPSGDLLYYENNFTSIDFVKIAISIVNKHTGQPMPGLSYSFFSWQLGGNK